MKRERNHHSSHNLPEKVSSSLCLRSSRRRPQQKQDEERKTKAIGRITETTKGKVNRKKRRGRKEKKEKEIFNDDARDEEIKLVVGVEREDEIEAEEDLEVVRENNQNPCDRDIEGNHTGSKMISPTLKNRRGKNKRKKKRGHRSSRNLHGRLRHSILRYGDEIGEGEEVEEQARTSKTTKKKTEEEEIERRIERRKRYARRTRELLQDAKKKTKKFESVTDTVPQKPNFASQASLIQQQPPAAAPPSPPLLSSSSSSSSQSQIQNQNPNFPHHALHGPHESTDAGIIVEKKKRKKKKLNLFQGESKQSARRYEELMKRLLGDD